jgi:hypothetical protein
VRDPQWPLASRAIWQKGGPANIYIRRAKWALQGGGESARSDT